MTEKDILYECINNEKKNFDVLIKRYHNPFYKFCYFLTKNKYDADDLYQQTWLKVYENIDKYNINYQFKNWLYTISHNLFKDYKRKAKHIVDLKDEELIIITKDSKDNKLLLEKAILSLKEELRIPIILFYYEGFKLDEISHILNIHLSKVKYRLKKAKELLYQKIEGESNE